MRGFYLERGMFSGSVYWGFLFSCFYWRKESTYLGGFKSFKSGV